MGGRCSSSWSRDLEREGGKDGCSSSSALLERNVVGGARVRRLLASQGHAIAAVSCACCANTYVIVTVPSETVVVVDSVEVIVSVVGIVMDSVEVIVTVVGVTLKVAVTVLGATVVVQRWQYPKWGWHL